MNESVTEIQNQNSPMIINIIIRNKEQVLKAELKSQYIVNIMTYEREAILCVTLGLKLGSTVGIEVMIEPGRKHERELSCGTGFGYRLGIDL